MQAVEIEGLNWLLNSPKHRVTVIDERGYAVDMSVPDPRCFAIHKAWMSSRMDRAPIKRRRDAEQARFVAGLVNNRLPHLRFDAHDLTALPAAMCRSAEASMAELPGRDETALTGLEPDW